MRTNENNSELSRIDYLILGSLQSNGATKQMFGLTIKEMDITEVQRSCVWKHLASLIEKNLVSQAGNHGKQKMYYITESGINLLRGI